MEHPAPYIKTYCFLVYFYQPAEKRPQTHHEDKDFLPTCNQPMSQDRVDGALVEVSVEGGLPELGLPVLVQLTVEKETIPDVPVEQSPDVELWDLRAFNQSNLFKVGSQGTAADTD